MVSHLRVVFLLYVCVTCGTAFHRRCILFGGRCVSYCPQNMHVYNTRCDGHTPSQRTCHEPHKYILGYTCGWSRCDCNGDLVLDEQTNKCIDLKDCPVISQSLMKKERKHSDQSRANRKNRISKRIRITENPLKELEP